MTSKHKMQDHYQQTLMTNHKEEKHLKKTLNEINLQSRQQMIKHDIECNALENQIKADKRNNALLKKNKPSFKQIVEQLPRHRSTPEVAQIFKRLLDASKDSVHCAVVDRSSIDQSKEEQQQPDVKKEENEDSRSVSTEPNMLKIITLMRNVRKLREATLRSHRLKGSNTKPNTKNGMSQQKGEHGESDSHRDGMTVLLERKIKKIKEADVPFLSDLFESKEAWEEEVEVDEDKMITKTILCKEHANFEHIQEKIDTFLDNIGPKPHSRPF